MAKTCGLVILLTVLTSLGCVTPAAPAGPLVWPNAVSRANSDPWIARHHDQITQMRPRLLVLNFANGVSAARRRGRREH